VLASRTIVPIINNLCITIFFFIKYFLDVLK
jgi:hypothetical protein